MDTQSVQERVAYDVCVLQKLAGVVSEVGTVINRKKRKEQRGKKQRLKKGRYLTETQNNSDEQRAVAKWRASLTSDNISDNILKDHNCISSPSKAVFY